MNRTPKEYKPIPTKEIDGELYIKHKDLLDYISYLYYYKTARNVMLERLIHILRRVVSGNTSL